MVRNTPPKDLVRRILKQVSVTLNKELHMVEEQALTILSPALTNPTRH